MIPQRPLRSLLSFILHPSSLILFLIVFSVAVYAADSKRVAVLDFRNPDGAVKPSEADYITEMVRTEARRMLPRDQYVLLTKENIYDMLPPDKRNLAQCEGQCEVETGRMIGAQYLVTGDIVNYGGELRVTVRLYDVATSNLLDSRKAAGKNPLDLEAPIERLSSVLFAVLPGSYRQPAPTPVPTPTPEPVFSPTPEPYVPPANADPAFEKLVREEQARIEAERRLTAERKAQLEADYQAVKGIHDSASYSADAKKAAYQKFTQKWSDDTTYAPQVQQWLSMGDVSEGFERIEAGRFLMGSPTNEENRDNDETQHWVTISKPYLMMTHELTVGEFRQFAQSAGYQTEAERNGTCWTAEGDKWVEKRGASWRNPGFSQDDRHPAVCVSWNDAVAYANWRSEREGLAKCYSGQNWDRSCTGYRLPTEAEWEFAARGGLESARYPWGNDSICGKANYCDGNCPFSWKDGGCNDGYTYTAPVGSFQANGYGLYDMAGNVWEWAWDWKADYPSGSVTDPVGPSGGSSRVDRGGSWGGDAQYCRSANRGNFDPGYRYDYLGFRLARSLP